MHLAHCADPQSGAGSCDQHPFLPAAPAIPSPGAVMRRCVPVGRMRMAMNSALLHAHVVGSTARRVHDAGPLTSATDVAGMKHATASCTSRAVRPRRILHEQGVTHIAHFAALRQYTMRASTSRRLAAVLRPAPSAPRALCAAAPSPPAGAAAALADTLLRAPQRQQPPDARVSSTNTSSATASARDDATGVDLKARAVFDGCWSRCGGATQPGTLYRRRSDSFPLHPAC